MLESDPSDASLIDGMRQRARLFELILADLLGARTIVCRDLLPSLLVPGPTVRRQRCSLRRYAVDLVRCPDGIWRVADDLAGTDDDPVANLLEAPALAGFLPGLCRFLLGERLRLASVPSRWLADPGALQEVVAHAHRWSIVDACARGTTTRLKNITTSQRITLQDRVDAAPWRFTARLLVEGHTRRIALTRADNGVWMVSSNDESEKIPISLTSR